MATVFNLFLDQGTTFKANITVKDRNGVIRDISGHTVESQFRRSYRSVSNTTSFAFIAQIPSGTDGNVLLMMNSNTTTNVTAAIYDVEMKSNTTGEIERVAEGIVLVNPEITR